MYRINHLSWWKEELPSEEEYQTAKASLARAGWEVDYIITHCCPASVQDIFSGGLYQKDALTEFFDEIRQRVSFPHLVIRNGAEQRWTNSYPMQNILSLLA